MMNGSAFKHYLDDCSMMTNEQLQMALDKFTEVLKKRHEAEREELRIKLMRNLQKAIGDILNNGFRLEIENIDNPNWVVQFNHFDESYHIEIE